MNNKRVFIAIIFCFAITMNVNADLGTWFASTKNSFRSIWAGHFQRPTKMRGLFIGIGALAITGWYYWNKKQASTKPAAAPIQSDNIIQELSIRLPTEEPQTEESQKLQEKADIEQALEKVRVVRLQGMATMDTESKNRIKIDTGITDAQLAACEGQLGLIQDISIENFYDKAQNASQGTNAEIFLNKAITAMTKKTKETIITNPNRFYSATVYIVKNGFTVLPLNLLRENIDLSAFAIVKPNNDELSDCFKNKRPVLVYTPRRFKIGYIENIDPLTVSYYYYHFNDQKNVGDQKGMQPAMATMDTKFDITAPKDFIWLIKNK